GRDHAVLGVAAVVRDAGDLRPLAVDEEALPARVALEAVASVPAHAHALADLPRGDVGPHRVDAPRDLVAGHARQGHPRERARADERVAVAHPAGLDLHADLVVSGLGYAALDDLERSVRLRDLYGLHREHGGFPLSALGGRRSKLGLGVGANQ